MANPNPKTVAELIEALKVLPPDKKVVVGNQFLHSPEVFDGAEAVWLRWIQPFP